MRIAVTGARGTLGSMVTADLAAAGHMVRAIDRVAAQTGASDRVEPVVADLRDRGEASRSLAGCEAVVHLAAWPRPDLASAETVWSDNLALVTNVAFAAVECGAGRMVHASSQSALGLAWADTVAAPDYIPVDERHPCRPADCYSASKLAGESLVAALARAGTFSAFALRFPVVWRHDAFAEHTGKRLSDPAQGAKSQWAYIDARDAARAARLAAEAQHEGFEILNVAARDIFETRSVAELARHWYGPGIGIRGNDPAVAYDVAAAEARLGFRARYRWTASGITDLSDA